MVRVISGQFRGLRLVSPAGRQTRPTADQVKEALFSMLVSLPFELAGCRALDVFAGSGALGLEALSRGAASVVLADETQAAAQAVARNLAAAGRDLPATFLRTHWPQGFHRLPAEQPFDLLLLDPPYEKRSLPLALLREAAALNLAAPGAVAVWEQAPETLAAWSSLEAAPWVVLKTRVWGHQAAAFLQYPHGITDDDQSS